jgi:hypothetical protein
VTKPNKRTSVATVDEPSPFVVIDVEPFAEFAELPCHGCPRGAFRFGYRCKRTGVVVVTVQIPASTVARSIQLKATARVTTDGRVIAESEIQNDNKHFRSSEAISLVQLIEETLHIDNLRMEEASPQELKRLLRELEVSIERAKAALTAMERPTSHRQG